jgi:hypothetical protein
MYVMLSAQEDISYNVIGWTLDNKVIYQESRGWEVFSEERIIVQDLKTDEVEDFLSMEFDWNQATHSDIDDAVIGVPCVIQSQSIRDSIYLESSLDSMKINIYLDNFLNKYNINKQSIFLRDNNYLEKYDLNIALRINNQGGEFDVLVGNKKLGYKKIGHGESSTEYDHIDIQYDGYYMSPLEPRILVVVTVIGRINNYLGGVEDYDHLEGEETIMECYFFRCNLDPSTFK